MSDVFLDAAGAIALINTSDQWHRAADAAYQLLKQSHREFITTAPVLLETGNAFSRTRYRENVGNLWTSFAAGGKIIFPSSDDYDEAWRLYRRGEAGDAGIVDCISFAVMRRLGLTEAFTNDQHFSAAGFVTLF
ncbi:MAG: PIN domain-containing protein [Planctomycetales bacterium]|nr:PIN domain-containing protein [Planctomycetales bacterium]